MTDKPLPRREAWLLARRKKRRRVLLWQVGLLLALFGLWQLTTSTGLSDGFLVSSPSRMWGTFLSLCRGGELLRHIGTSCLETVVGFLAGTLLGTAVAICMWWWDGVARVLNPYLVVLNALPKTALGPIFIVWMGAGMGSIIVMTLAISLIVTILSMYQGFLGTDGEKLRPVVGGGHYGGISRVPGGPGLSHRLRLSGVQHGPGDDQRVDPGRGGGGDVPAGAGGREAAATLLGGQSMKKICIAGCLCLALLLLLPGCAGKRTLTSVRLSEVTHSVFYAPQYVAMSQGFFREEGLDVELTNGGGADKVMTAVVSGQADMGLAGPEAAIYVMNQGKEDHPVILAQLTKRDGSFLVGQIRGKTIIGGRAGGVPEMTLEYVLRQNGVEPQRDAVVDTSVQFNMMAGAFTGGNGDYVTLFEPTATEVEQAGKGYILCSIGQESGEIPYTAYFAARSYVDANPETVQGFVNAIARAQQWVAEHTDRQVAEAICDQFPDTDLDILERVCARHREIDAWNRTPVMERQSLERLETVMTQAGELAADQWVSFDQLVDNRFAQKANTQ